MQSDYNNKRLYKGNGENMADVRKRLVFYGRVQGVGFRYTAKYLAKSLGLTGWGMNEYDGTEPMIHKLMEGLNRNGFISIDWIDSKDIPTVDESCFYVR